MRISESELILNPDGSIYHLNLKPGQIATDIITVGDPDRVDKVSAHFDNIEISVSKREFKTVTGNLKGKRITVISTGIGTDNIDIVFTELDALVNIDFETRERKDEHTSLNFYRIGTSGSLRTSLDIDNILISRMAIGLESLMHYYNYEISEEEHQLTALAQEQLSALPSVTPYAISSSKLLAEKFASLGRWGITVTATGFYGPQGRTVLASPKSKNFLDDLAKITLGDLECTNLEMETAGIYGMSRLLGHEAISINAILANRVDQSFSKSPDTLVDQLIEDVLVII